VATLWPRTTEFGTENQICERPEVDEILDLGMVLGQNQAFSFIASRCSAAQAEGLRQLRNEKLYKRITEHWNDFCTQYLRMSGSQADKIIRLFEEFGPGYFDMAQLTRVSPETYRLIEPSINEGVLKVNGEEIALTVENSRRVAAAVTGIRRALPKRSVTIRDRISRLSELTTEIMYEFKEIPDSAERNHGFLVFELDRLQLAITRFREQMGM
jgi:hypothetical protein